MRHRTGSLNGVMDLVFVRMIELFRHEGKEGLNLGLAPLAGTSELPTIVDRALAVLRSHGDRWFHFAGLDNYKNKRSPRWEPRYLACRSRRDLPRVARAVQRAGELPEPDGSPGRVHRLARQFPVSLALGGIVIWLMALTSIDPHFNAVLVRVFGLS